MEKKIRILEQHGIPYYMDNGKLFADSMIAGTALFYEVENVTEWTISELYIWLGY